jgi:ankyrin repeat protein
MIIFTQKVKKLIERKDFQVLAKLLSENPNLANEGITIPFDFFCRQKEHPLHRICDAIFARKISDDDGIIFAKIFLENGAKIDGDKINGGGTPILAAASLHAEKLGIFYIESGADIHYTYQNNGETALHWASFCGRDKLVDRLIRSGAEIDGQDKTYNSTPLGWAIHSLQSNDTVSEFHQVDCIKLLLQHGAETKKLDKGKNDYLQLMAKNDLELQTLMN